MPSGAKARIPNRQIIQNLVEAGYDGFFDVELIGESVEQFDYPTLIRQSREFMTEIFATKH